MEMMQREMQLRDALKKILDDRAFERLANIRLANKELYYQIAQMIIYAYQQGQIQGKLSEEVLLKLVGRIKWCYDGKKQNFRKKNDPRQGTKAKQAHTHFRNGQDCAARHPQRQATPLAHKENEGKADDEGSGSERIIRVLS